MKSAPSSLGGPRVSRAMGTKSYAEVSWEYFSVFFSPAFTAAAPAMMHEYLRLLAARVSVHVTSHVRHFPPSHGIFVSPSGRLPSVRSRPEGSFMAGTPAFTTALQMMSLSNWWR